MKKLQSDLNLEIKIRPKMVFWENFHNVLCPPIFESNLCNCEMVGLSGPPDLIQDQNVLLSSLQHLAVLFLLFDQVVAMTSHLTMPGWHHQGTGLRPAKYAQCRPLSRWMYVGRREDGWSTSCDREADWTHNHVTAIWLWSFTFKLSLCTL